LKVKIRLLLTDYNLRRNHFIVSASTNWKRKKLLWKSFWFWIKNFRNGIFSKNYFQ